MIKKKQKLRNLILAVVGIMMLLTIILVVHIAAVKPDRYDNSYMQISRIDFEEPLDSLKMKEIHGNLKEIPGFINDSYDMKKGVLVFFHNNKIADSKTIYEQLMKKGNYKAKRFTLPASLQKKQVCPLINQGSFNYKITKTIQSIF